MLRITTIGERLRITYCGGTLWVHFKIIQYEKFNKFRSIKTPLGE